MAFVKEAEALIERGQAERLRGEEGVWVLLWRCGQRELGTAGVVSHRGWGEVGVREVGGMGRWGMEVWAMGGEGVRGGRTAGKTWLEESRESQA